MKLVTVPTGVNSEENRLLLLLLETGDEVLASVDDTGEEALLLLAGFRDLDFGVSGFGKNITA